MNILKSLYRTPGLILIAILIGLAIYFAATRKPYCTGTLHVVGHEIDQVIRTDTGIVIVLEPVRIEPVDSLTY